MARTVELRRHTDADGDVLTADGVRMAVEIGRRSPGAYDVLISSGAQRATQTAACFLAGMGRAVTGGVIVNSRLPRRAHAFGARNAYRTTRKGASDAVRNSVLVPGNRVESNLVCGEQRTTGY
jgi:hypothetical protein